MLSGIKRVLLYKNAKKNQYYGEVYKTNRKSRGYFQSLFLGQRFTHFLLVFAMYRGEQVVVCC